MAITNQERVGKALDLLKAGLAPFVEREVKSAMKNGQSVPAVQAMAEDSIVREKPITQWDSALLLKLMWDGWNDVFRKTLGPAERGLVGEVRGYRNRWAHQEPFSGDDADRALDSIARLLTAVSASQANEVGKMKMELRRLIFDEQMRSEKRKSAGTAIESQVTGSLKPWREVVTPHKDVASGRYQQAEFAADLWQVHLGEGTDEYRNPVEFFRRTYSDRESQGDAGWRRAAAVGQRRRPGGATPNQLRRRQDALDVGALSPVFGHCADGARRYRLGDDASGSHQAPDRETRGAGGQ